MIYSNLNKVMETFGDESIRLARRNLNLTGFARKGKKINNSKDLSKGLGYELTSGKKGFVIEFTTQEGYGIFVEDGVDGWKKNVGGKYKFKKKIANLKAIEKYIRSSKVKLRKTYKNSNGQKTSKLIPKNSKNIKSATFAMAKAIARDGMKPTNYMGEAVNEAFEKLPPIAEQAIVKDMEDILFLSFKNDPNIKVTIT